MDLKDFKYELPDSLIASYPSRDRHASRLLVVKRSSGELIHSVFSQLGSFLDPGDLLVLNDAKVFPARLHGVKESGGKVEVLLLERFPDKRSLWIAIVNAAKKPAVGSQIRFSENMTARVIGAHRGISFYSGPIRGATNKRNRQSSIDAPCGARYLSTGTGRVCRRPPDGRGALHPTG